MARAIAIGRWALEHAIAATGMMGLEPGQQLAARILDRAKRRGITRFTAREVLRWFRGESQREVDQALAVLLSRGAVKETARAAPKTGGRPSRAFEVVQ